MCYSAMVEQDAKVLASRFHGRVQLDMYEDIFRRRLAGEKVRINKAMERSFRGEASPQLKQIQELIDKWHQGEESRLQKELFKQKRRLDKAELELKVKESKKYLDEKRIASHKIQTIQQQLKKNETMEFVSDDEKSVFPFTYLSMVTMGRDKKLVVAPFRYHMRPHDQSESFDRRYNGCYNARKDNLGNPFWAPVFGRRHGLIVVSQFYEHVMTRDYLEHNSLEGAKQRTKNLILSFQPQNFSTMLIPTIWDTNKATKGATLFSCALLTDEPPPEVAATGHNRCPIFLKEQNVEKWLTPEGRSMKELYSLLDDRESTVYKHQVVQAA